MTAKELCLHHVEVRSHVSPWALRERLGVLNGKSSLAVYGRASAARWSSPPAGNQVVPILRITMSRQGTG